MRNLITLSSLLTAATCAVMLPAKAQIGPASGSVLQTPEMPQMQDDAIIVHPSPFDRELNVRFNVLPVRGNVIVDVVDLSSDQVVLTRTTAPRSGAQFNTEGIPVGRYRIRITDELTGKEVASVNASRIAVEQAELGLPGEASGSRGAQDGEAEGTRTGRNPFIAYPNPFNEEIRIRMDTRRIRGIVNVVLRHSQTGTVVYTGSADPRAGELVIETSAIPSGLFVLRLDTQDGEHLGNLPMVKK